MTKPTRLVVGSLTLALTLPALAWAQAVPRGSGGSGSSGGSSSSGSSGGSSSGGSSSGGSSSGGSSYGPPPNSAAPPPMPPPSRRAPEGSNVNGASPRGSGGVNNQQNSSGNDPRSRDRNGRPQAGSAVPRQPGSSENNGFFNRFAYPYYGYGNTGLNFSYGYSPYYGYSAAYGYLPYSPFGYNAYDPFYYSRWGYGRYGMWNDPYNSYGFADPYDGLFGGMGGGAYSTNLYGYGGGSLGAYSSSAPEVMREATGEVRLRVKPDKAQVYLDGNLVGTVDQFDGLGTHLAATTGTHEVEIRADGYEPLKLTVDVPRDRTVTARGSLKKK